MAATIVHAMSKPVVSVVLAAKDAAPEIFDLCLRSFAALRQRSRLQIVIVASGSVPDVEPSLIGHFSSLIRVNVPPAGVYAAYNAGIPLATGRYLLFFGIDDIALPAMDRVIEGLAASDCHVFASACHMQAGGLRRPSRYRISLAFRNWCHQGIFYALEVLADRRYQTEYRVRADHKMNIDILSDPSVRLEVSREPVAYCSAGGLSSLQPDILFMRDFPRIVSQTFGRPVGALVRFKQWLIDLFLGPPERWFRPRSR